MYQPKHFEPRDSRLALKILSHDHFATLITQHEESIEVNHFPLLYKTQPGPHGTLIGHMARANPQWRALEAGAQALAIFHGPHSYVSHTWYVTNDSHVPTWNYVVVHAWGKARILSDDEALAQLQELVTKHEGQPIGLDEQRAALAKAIVGFEITIERLECKAKLSQNRDPQDRAAVTEKFLGQTDPRLKRLGELMRDQ